MYLFSAALWFSIGLKSVGHHMTWKLLKFFFYIYVNQIKYRWDQVAQNKDGKNENWTKTFVWLQH